MIAATKIMLGLIGVAGVGLVMSSPGNAAAKPAPPPGKKPAEGPTMPPKLVADVEAARALGDPKQLRALASRLLAAGFAGASSDLMHLAAEIDAATGKPSPTPAVAPEPSGSAPSDYTSPGQPQPHQVRSVPVFVPGKGPVTIPMVLPRAPAVTTANPPDMRQLQAGQLALSLIGRRAGTENREKVKKFQDVNGLKGDGLYGPQTAMKLAELGIVPPQPLYWPKNNPLAAKRAYKAAFLAKAASDVPRRQEWTASANAVRL